MATVAQCADATPPADGSAFSGCTSVVWVSHTDISELSQADISTLFGSVALLLAGVFVWRKLRTVL
jgi:hypothetical protein